jgi:hypothetical protein
MDGFSDSDGTSEGTNVGPCDVEGAADGALRHTRPRSSGSKDSNFESKGGDPIGRLSQALHVSGQMENAVFFEMHTSSWVPGRKVSQPQSLVVPSYSKLPLLSSQVSEHVPHVSSHW